jgi:hypothetical protein
MNIKESLNQGLEVINALFWPLIGSSILWYVLTEWMGMDSLFVVFFAVMVSCLVLIYGLRSQNEDLSERFDELVEKMDSIENNTKHLIKK